MPRIFEALKMETPELTLEVQQQLGDGVVRTIAMGSTDGLRRGMEVLATRQPDHGSGGPGHARPHHERARHAHRRSGSGSAEKHMPIHRKAPAYADQAPRWRFSKPASR